MQLKPLYEVKLIEANRQHYYQIGDNEDWKPGVTTVLKCLDKPALLPWGVNLCSSNIKEALLNKKGEGLTNEEIEKICEEGKNIYKKKAEDAAGIGTRVHKAINDIIRGDRSEQLPEDVKAGVQGFLNWKASNSLTIELGDTKIGSKLFGYGGSLDFMGFDSDGQAVIFDIKTTRARKGMGHGIYPEAAVQLSAYRRAFMETYGIPVKAVYGLWLNKDKPEFKAVKVSNPELCFEEFLACLKIYQMSKFEKFDESI